MMNALAATYLINDRDLPDDEQRDVLAKGTFQLVEP